MHWTGAWIIGIAVLVCAFAAALILHHTRAGALLKERIPDRPQRRLLLAAVAFLLTFCAVRGLAWSIHHHLGPFHDVSMGGRHIHHMVWGILLLLAVGFGWLAEIGNGEGQHSAFMGRLMSLLYGAGAAMTLDEFALWLNLRDVYWARAGRSSLDAALIFFVLCVIAYILARAQASRRSRGDRV